MERKISHIIQAWVSTLDSATHLLHFQMVLHKQAVSVAVQKSGIIHTRLEKTEKEQSWYRGTPLILFSE